MLAAEDARGAGAEGLTPLTEGLASDNIWIRRAAVRGLGRLEADSLVPIIATLLDDADAGVRAAAANALGQAVYRGAPGRARTLLADRLALEADAAVRGIIAETLGRIRHATSAEVQATIVAIAGTPQHVVEAPVDPFLLGAARGLFFLARQPAARDSIPDFALDAFRNLLVTGLDAATREAQPLDARRTRTVAAAAFVATRRATPDDVMAILRDGDPLVRREGIAAVAALPAEQRSAALESLLRDSSAIVRFAALRSLAASLAPAGSCPQVLQATLDSDAHVRNLAIASLASGCAGADATPRLDSLAASLSPTLPDTGTGWQMAAHALVSLAATDAQRARGRLDGFVASANPFVRMYAARAAARLRDLATLQTLSADVVANVRNEAVQGLVALQGRAADSVLIRQLRENDSQLLQTAADALEGTRSTAALPALLDAMDRISSARRETWRDARMALLRRIAELGSARDAERLRPWLADYDVRVADAVAQLLGRWSGTRPEATPAALPRLVLPSFAALDSLERVTVALQTSAGTLEIRLFPFDAPTNAWRFARLAREGWFNGLTFHRVEPNFVLQGGSPAANEYAGDGPFTRDEVGLGNWRGTLGISTRGRDTGDAQIFVNLIDNTRLDHNYTVFARIVTGEDVMDRVLEGTVIHRITFR